LTHFSQSVAMAANIVFWSYTHKTGCESIYVARNCPKVYLSLLEGWHKSPIGGSMRRGLAWIRLFEGYCKNGMSDRAVDFYRLSTRNPPGWDLEAPLKNLNTGNVISKARYENIASTLYHETFIFCNVETLAKPIMQLPFFVELNRIMRRALIPNKAWCGWQITESHAPHGKDIEIRNARSLSRRLRYDPNVYA